MKNWPIKYWKRLHIVRDRLVLGVPFFDLANYENSHGHLVGIDTSLLDFGGAYAPGFHLFSGGEWHMRTPLHYKGGNPNESHLPWRHRSHKVELWSLVSGWTIAVADRSNGLRLLKVGREEVSLVMPTPQEVRSYLYERKRAFERSTNGARGLAWVEASLVAIAERYGPA